MSGESLKAIEKMRKAMEEKHDDDMESIVTDEEVSVHTKSCFRYRSKRERKN